MSPAPKSKSDGAPAPRRRRAPHVRRERSTRFPYHVVLKFRRGRPQPHFRRVQSILRRWIAEVQDRYGVFIGIEVGMPLHAHLVVETPPAAGTIGQAMRFLCSKGALEVNRTFRLRGPLFQERFWSRVIGSMSEVIRTIRYIAENPVKARYVRQAGDWKASSVRDFVHGIPHDLWRFRGLFFAKLGFLEDPVRVLRDILSGRRLPVVHRGGRQQRLPFAEGLPALASP